MAPVDQQTALMQAAPQGPPGGTIGLSTLMEYIIQRTYNDLSVMSELLPRKTDMERKIDIAQFACKTRQLFVRLLALVKWANSAGKVDKCAMISNFLDKQASLFVDTADLLAKMSRETLVNARLPSFSIPCAIDVLTTGTYPRLPTCIKEKIVPPDPISREEKLQTLSRLTQVIEHRLVSSDLPAHMRLPVIANGRVKFHVDHEFEVTLTLMGDGMVIPWRLLDIEILVEDPETGNGKALVHSLQINYIHQLIQSRLMDNDKPLHDLYNVLHSFCQSLQLEVLYLQTHRLIQERLGEHVRIEEYIAGRSLIVSYWRDPQKREMKPMAQIFKLSIHVDDDDGSKPLQITHFPQIQGLESSRVAKAIRTDHLSIEKLLINTIQVRSVAKLKDLEREIRLLLPGPCEIRDLPTLLYTPIVYPCLTSEMVCVAINVQKGNFLVSINGNSTDLTQEVEDCINGDRRDLRKMLTRIRLWLGLERCRKSMQHLQAQWTTKLPFISTKDHSIEKLGRDKLFIKMAKLPNYYMIVEAFEGNRRSLDYRYYLLNVSPTTYELAPGESSEDIPLAYLKPEHMMQLDTFTSTHGSTAKLHEIEEQDSSSLARKRKLLMGNPQSNPTKRQKTSPYFVPELTHILALCEDKIPFVWLGEELQKRGIFHQGIQVDGEGVGLALTLVNGPPCQGLEEAMSKAIKSDLLSCKFRMQRKSMVRVCLTEWIFANCPVSSLDGKEKGPIHRVYSAYDLNGSDSTEKIVQLFIDDWNSIAHLYAAVKEFSYVFKETRGFNGDLVVKSYTYKRLTLGYGPNQNYTAHIHYKIADAKFQLTFGTVGPIAIANGHTLLTTQLENELNNCKSIARLAQILVDTLSPVCSISKLPTGPILGHQTPSVLGHQAHQNKNYQNPCPVFTVLPQSSTRIRVEFMHTYCLDIQCKAGKIVALRDGAYHVFETNSMVNSLSPIAGIKAFLNLFVDESVQSSHNRRRSTAAEDDNPPSPVAGLDLDSIVSQSSIVGSPSSRAGKDRSGFHNPLTPPSNPLTPASPATMRGSQQSHHSPAGSNFPLASPPSLHGIAPSPGNVMAPSPSNPTLHAPSPSSFVAAPSPSSMGIHMPSPAQPFISPQAMVEGGSPYHRGTGADLAMPSPGARNWPNSPSVPGPSPAGRHGTHSPGHPALHSPQGTLLSPPHRILPQSSSQRSWAASVPTLLSHEALSRLLSPCSPPSQTLSGPTAAAQPLCSPLERFLHCTLLRRGIQRHTTLIDNDHLQIVQTNKPGASVIKTDHLNLTFEISLNPANLQSLHLKVTPNENANIKWEQEELQLLEKYFDNKIVCPPYKMSTVTTFMKMLTTPVRIFKDLIQIIRLEMFPEKNMRWSVQLCTFWPHNASNPKIMPPGHSSFYVQGGKIVFSIQLTRMNQPNAPLSDLQSIHVPIVYDMNTKSLSSMPPDNRPGNQQPPATLAINQMFKRFSEYNLQPSDCSIYPAVRELLSNLAI